MTMAQNPTVSVVMPAFNAEKFIVEAIESILSQTLTDFEFIIIDDGSTDNTAQVVGKYQARDARVQVHRQGNCGFATSFNRGCSLAKGKYIAFMGADDLCHPQRFARQVEFLEKNPHIGICGAWMHAFEGEKKTLFRYPADPDIAKSMLPFQLSVSAGSVIFSRDIYLTSGVINNPNVGATDDYLFLVELARHCELASVPKPLYLYRIHPEQVTKREDVQQRKFTRQIRLMQLEQLGLKPSDDELDIHEAIADWRLFGDRHDIDRAQDWLANLKRANALKSLYPEPAFSEVLGNYWFSVCLRHAKFGLWTYERFSSSPLVNGAKIGLGQRSKLLAKCVTGYDRRKGRRVHGLRTDSDY